ncbi:MAG: phage tail tube protein [Sulfuriferula sp.]
MASTAISAQGSILQIGTTTGVAKNVTGLQLGNPTVVLSTAHGFANGDVVTFAAIVGNLTLNGLTAVVRNVTTNSYAVDVDTTGGAAWVSGGTATPVTWTKISNVRDYAGFDGQASELDKTNLDSTAKEFALGLVDPGQLNVNVDRDQTDAGQLAVEAARVSGAIKNFKLTLPNTKTATFTGYVKKFGAQGGVDALFKAAIDIRISGAVTWA